MNCSKLASLLAFSATTSLFAQTNWIFDTDKYETYLKENSKTSVDWSVTLGDASVSNSSFWYTGSGDSKTYFSGTAMGESDSISIGSDTYTKSINIKLDQASLTLDKINFAGSAAMYFMGLDRTNKLTVNNISSTQSSGSLTLNNLDLSVSDTLQGAYGYVNMQNMTKIDIGTLTALGSSGVRYQVSAYGDSATSATNPSIKIGSILTGDGIYFNNIGTSSKELYYSIGSSDCAITSLQNSNDKTVYLILTPQDTTKEYRSMYGLRIDKNNVDAYAKLRIIMNGKAGAVQNVDTPAWTTTACNQVSNGGIEVISGTLKISFYQSATAYSYDNTTAKTRDSYIAADGTTITTFSHGDLEMNGADGVFGSYKGQLNNGYGAFRFTNLKYKDGTIALRLTNAKQYDSLDLTSYYKAQANIKQDENDKWILDGVYTLGEKVEGGTVTKLGDKDITFDFGEEASLYWLIDYEDGEFAYGDGIKIIAWDASKKANLTSDDFFAKNIQDSGDEFRALFTLADDGLYVKYVAVPEPSTYAAIFGALALGFAFYRRRK